MNHRKSFIVGVVSLAITAVVCICSTGKAEELGIDIWHIGELERQIACCETAKTAMEQEDQIVMRRMACRQTMLKNLIAKRITFNEAVRGFHTLNKELPISMNVLALTYGDSNEWDAAKNQVLAHLKTCQYPGSREYLMELSHQEVAHW